MNTFIFVVGLIVSIMVIFGIFSQVPGQIRAPDKVDYFKSDK
jgi:hypothetical protein